MVYPSAIVESKCTNVGGMSVSSIEAVKLTGVSYGKSNALWHTHVLTKL